MTGAALERRLAANCVGTGGATSGDMRHSRAELRVPELEKQGRVQSGVV